MCAAGLTHHSVPQTDRPPTFLADKDGMARLRRDMGRSISKPDKALAFLAAKAGYASVQQAYPSHSGSTRGGTLGWEIIATSHHSCSGSEEEAARAVVNGSSAGAAESAILRVHAQACAPLGASLRTGWNGQAACWCSAKHDILNCAAIDAMHSYE